MATYDFHKITYNDADDSILLPGNLKLTASEFISASGGDLVFTDTNNGAKTLAQLAAGGGGAGPDFTETVTVTISETGSPNFGYAFVGNYENTGTGTPENIYDFYSIIGNSGSGSNNFGYGFYVESIDATSPFGVFVNDANAVNYFAGNIGIGTTTPTGDLEIENSVNTGSSIIMSTGTASVWTKIGDGTTDFGGVVDDVRSLCSCNGKLYAGFETPSAVYEYDGSSWTQIADNSGLNSSWTGREGVLTMIVYQGKLTVGLGRTNTADSEVWQWDGSSWALVSVNSSTFTGANLVQSSTVFRDKLIVGVGAGTNDGDVYEWDGISTTSWTSIGTSDSDFGGDKEAAQCMTVINDTLYVGFGTGNDNADIWSWDGTSWTQVADGTTDFSSRDTVFAINEFQGKLTAAIGGGTAGEAEVWQWDGASTWTQIGGDGINNSWADSTFATARTAIVYNNKLYVGLGILNDQAEVWCWDGTTWTQVGNTTTDIDSGTNAIECVTIHNDRLVFGTGLGSAAETCIYEYAENKSHVFYKDSNEDLKIQNSITVTDEGFIGINKDRPEKALDVIGEFRVGHNTIITEFGRVGIGKEPHATNTLSVINGGDFGGSLAVDGNITIATDLNGNIGADAARFTQIYLGDSGIHIGVSGGEGTISLDGSDNMTFVDPVAGTKVLANMIEGTGTANQVLKYSDSDTSTDSRITDDGSKLGIGNTSPDHAITLYSNPSFSGIHFSHRLNPSWQKVAESSTTLGSTMDAISSYVVYDNKMYIGTAGATDEASIWKWDGKTWELIADGTVFGTTYNGVYSLEWYKGKLYAGFGTTNDISDNSDADIWEWDGVSAMSGFTQIADKTTWQDVGERVKGTVNTLLAYKGKLLIALHSDASTGGDLFEWDGSGPYIGFTKLKDAEDWAAGTVSINNAYCNTIYDGKAVVIAREANATDGSRLFLYDGETFEQIAYASDDIQTNGTPNFANTIVWNGKLILTTNGGAGDGQIWMWGNKITHAYKVDSTFSTFTDMIEYIHNEDNDISFFDSDDDYIVFGADEKFNVLNFDLNTVATADMFADGSGIASRVEFLNGSGTWTAPSGAGATFTDNTSGFTSSGYIYWEMEDDTSNFEEWQPDSITLDSGVTVTDKFWFRFRRDAATGTGPTENKIEIKWTQIGGQGVNGFPDGTNTNRRDVNNAASFNGKLYIINQNQGTTAGEAWVFDGNLWTQIATDADDWGGGHNNPGTLFVFQNKLYAGLGVGGSDGDVFYYDVGGPAIAKSGNAIHLSNTMEIFEHSVGINTNSNSPRATLDVNGSFEADRGTFYVNDGKVGIGQYPDEDFNTAIMGDVRLTNEFAGSPSLVYGFSGFIDNLGSGTASDVYDFYSLIGNGGSGANTNAYSFFGESISATNPFGVVIVDFNAINFFAGKVGIGPSKSNPTEELEVDGTVLVSQDSDSISVPALTVEKPETGVTSPNYSMHQARVQTTDVSSTPIFSFNPDNDHVYLVEARVVARRNDGTEGASYIKTASFRDASGTVTQIGTTTEVSVHEDAAAWNTTIAVSGSNILVSVVGENSKTINWNGTFIIQKIQD